MKADPAPAKKYGQRSVGYFSPPPCGEGSGVGA
jgi:hypothetical protein